MPKVWYSYKQVKQDIDNGNVWYVGALRDRIIDYWNFNYCASDWTAVPVIVSRDGEDSFGVKVTTYKGYDYRLLLKGDKAHA
jgi:hypothetical protein